MKFKQKIDDWILNLSNWDTPATTDALVSIAAEADNKIKELEEKIKVLEDKQLRACTAFNQAINDWLMY